MSPYLARPLRSPATVLAELLYRAAIWHAVGRPDLARPIARKALDLSTHLRQYPKCVPAARDG